MVIDNFLHEMKDIRFIPDENQEPRDEFNYSITLFEANLETFQFGLTQVDDDYSHTEPDLYPIVAEFYKEVNVKEE